MIEARCQKKLLRLSFMGDRELSETEDQVKESVAVECEGGTSTAEGVGRIVEITKCSLGVVESVLNISAKSQHDTNSAKVQLRHTIGKTATFSTPYLGNASNNAEDIVDFPEPGTPAKAMRTRSPGAVKDLAATSASIRLQRRETLSDTSGDCLAMMNYKGLLVVQILTTTYTLQQRTTQALASDGT
jgi:hypothetical protein